MVGVLLFVITCSVLVFLVTGSYARVEVVPGGVSLDKGVASVIPSRTGIITQVFAIEGQAVKAGDQLAVIQSEESMLEGDTASKQVRHSLDRQESLMRAQEVLLLQAATADRRRMQAQIDGDEAEAGQINAQIAYQTELVDAAQAAYDNAAIVAKGGFISRRDLEERHAVILSRRQQLAQMQQALSAKQAEIAELSRSIEQAARSAEAQEAGSKSSRIALSQQRAQAEASRGYIVRAPINGRITALTARPGQPAAVDQQMMIVVPDKALLRADLYIPDTAIGFIAPGQDVRLSVDAFPYQSFGTVPAHITYISDTTVMRKAADGATTPVYLAVASIERPWVPFLGRKRALLPGMSLSARVVTRKRSLLAWLFEPLYLARG